MLLPSTVCEIAKQLSRKNIACELCGESMKHSNWNLMHIKGGKIADYLSDDILRERNRQWYLLYKQMLKKYRAELMGKKIDFWIYLGDIPEIAYWAVKLNLTNNDRIFSYSTMSGIEDIVIPVPDYTYYEVPEGIITYISFEECVEKLKKRSRQHWKYEKAFWIGGLDTHVSRKKLYLLGKMHSNELEIRSFDWKTDCSKFVPMFDLYQYKYLIAARGYGGWDDRLKMLFRSNRVVFVNERDCREFWMMYGLEAGIHYISVREDFSDLIEKKKQIDLHPEQYQKIVEEMNSYVEKYLSKDFALQYMKDTILKYAVYY